MEVLDLDNDIYFHSTDWFQRDLPFGFEFNADAVASWMSRRPYIPIATATLYIAAIFGLQSFMTSRKPIRLQVPLILWNALLAVFNLLVACAAAFQVPGDVFQAEKFHRRVCDNRYVRLSDFNALLAVLFVVSKFLELGDTLFIVIRKRRLVFIHWYHHTIALLATWFGVAEIASIGQLYSVCNLAVHSMIHAYFALKRSGFRFSKTVPLMLNVFQIAQNSVAVFLNIWAYRAKKAGLKCDVSDNLLGFLSVLAFTYFIFFLKFFYDSYLRPATSKVDNYVASKQIERRNGAGKTLMVTKKSQ